MKIGVSDEGVGTAAERLDDIFEGYFTIKDSGAGTGLGLSACQSIMREHGVGLPVESEIARGSCFTVYLPEKVD